MFNELNSLKLQIADFFNTPIFQDKLIYINYYSFVHITTGFLIMFFIYKFFRKNDSKFLTFFSIIILWEIFEIATILVGSSFFRKDSLPDSSWDLIAGTFGGSLYLMFGEKPEK